LRENQKVMRNFLLGLFLCLALYANGQSVRTFQTPGVNEYCNIDTQLNRAILPSGRRVTPAGQVVRITHDPFGMAVSPDGKSILTLHDGVITLIDPAQPQQALRIPSYDGKITGALEGASFLGVAFAADGKLAYLSQGDKGKVVVFDLAQRKKIASIDLNGELNGVKYEDSFTSDLALHPNKSELLVLDRGNFRLVRIDLASQKVTASIPVGRQPFGLAISQDGKTALVANVGLYAYPAVPGVTPNNRDTMMLDFPPYGTYTLASVVGDTLEDGRIIPGLGSPLAPEAMSVFAIDLQQNRISSIFKTGRQIGHFLEDAEVVGGASPNSIAMGKQFAYVSNATNDLISVIDLQQLKVVTEFPIKVDKRLDKHRGLMPFGLTLNKAETQLYVALLGFNAVAVIDLKSKKTLGLIPTGWGPSRVLLSPDEKNIYITSIRGLGAGQNGGKGFVKPARGTYIGDIQQSTFQAVPFPDKAQLELYTAQTLANTFQEVKVADNAQNPLPALPGLRQSPIKHIVYITKENRTFDEVFGQLPNINGDPSLARYGANVTVSTRKDTIRGANIMPNHHKIAQQWAVSDNFYCDSDASIHGHHWMMGVVPNEWVEANSSADGAFKTFSTAPGRRFPKATGAIDPEDYNEIGGLWEALERKKVPFFNFGEGNEYAGVWEEWDHLAFGAKQPVIFPLQKAVYDKTSRFYAGFDMDLPDQVRVDQFEREFTDRWLSGKAEMPALVAMQLPNDHGAGVRPEAGFPYEHSYMADNDLALGRILQFLSKTPYWKNMLVIVTEDDPQGGVDHIDAHRSVLMMAGPYVKRNHVSKTHANFGSLLKTIYNILDIPYVNQYDVTATLLQDFFTPEPDLSPYEFVVPDQRVFDAKKAMEIYEKTYQWSEKIRTPMDDPKDQRKKFYKKEEK
jgi:YVTN family beta-propeller protein